MSAVAQWKSSWEQCRSDGPLAHLAHGRITDPIGRSRARDGPADRLIRAARCASYHRSPMRHAADDRSATSHSGGSESAPLASVSLDRLSDRVQRVVPRLSRVSDLMLVGVAVALALVDVAVWATDPAIDRGQLPLSIAIVVPGVGTSAVIAVALRRRHPATALGALACTSVVVTLACWAIGTSLPPSFAALFGLALFTSTALRREPGGTAVLLASLAALAVAAEALRPMVSATAYLLVVCEGALGVAVGVGVYLRWSDWRRVAAEEEARTHERLELARELHDMVGHYVTGIVVRAQAARHVAERRPAAAAVLESIEIAGADAMVAMRHMVGGLRHDTPTSATASGAAWADIDRLIANSIAAGEPVHATIDPDLRSNARSLVPSVQRIIVESLTNVRRHGHEVTRVDIDVARRADRLVLTVSNDGLATQRSAHDTFGIIGMRERATALGGCLIAGPAAGGGWLVHAELPIGRSR